MKEGVAPMIDKHSTVPVYLQLEQYLNGQIAAGTLRPGDVIPLKTRCASNLPFPE
jgi:DNA-binding transcriptional regulator YhcF (GntR family)